MIVALACAAAALCAACQTAGPAGGGRGKTDAVRDSSELANAAASEGGIAKLFGEGVEVVSPGPAREDFSSEEEWAGYWAHFHERDVALKHGFVIVRDADGRQYVPGETLLSVDSSLSDREIGEIVEGRGLHVADIARSEGAPSLVTVYSDDIAADVDAMGGLFAGVEGVTPRGRAGREMCSTEQDESDTPVLGAGVSHGWQAVWRRTRSRERGRSLE